MDASSSSSKQPAPPDDECRPPPPKKKLSELQALQKLHDDQCQRMDELKEQIKEAKLSLEKKEDKRVSDKEMEDFRALCERYNSLREEYNELLMANNLIKL